MSKPTLSVAMIIGNENVDGLLALSIQQSLRVADEVVVVSNGCDGSADVARCAGAAVYDWPWAMDFALMRNRSLGYCTGDFILVLDSDELIGDDFVADWQDLLTGADAYLLPTYNFATSGSDGWPTQHSLWYPDPHHRLFRNTPKIRYTRSLHEYPIGYDEQWSLPHHIYHYGWARDMRVLEERMKRRNAEEVKTGTGEGKHVIGEALDYSVPFTGKHPELFTPEALTLRPDYDVWLAEHGVER